MLVHSHVVFAYDVDSEFLTESDKKMKVSFAVDECPIGAFDVVDEDLHRKYEYNIFYKGIVPTHLCVLLPYLSMLVRSRKIIVLGRDMLTRDVEEQTLMLNVERQLNVGH